jgi:RNA polymerase sigma-70 factor, ECF subfamily
MPIRAARVHSAGRSADGTEGVWSGRAAVGAGRREPGKIAFPRRIAVPATMIFTMVLPPKVLPPKAVPIPVGVREQFEALLAEVHGFALARCGDRALAEDVTQDAFAAAITAWRAGRADALGAPFLVTVARNKLVDHWRRAQREEAKRVRAYERPIGDVDELLAEIDITVRRERVLAALGELSLAQRTALTFHYLDGLPVAELARQVGSSEHAAESLLARAREKFRLAYRRSGDD